MEANLDKKTCKMCSMEIPKTARKCPYCHHFQSRLALVMFHPAFAAIIICLPLFGMSYKSSRLFDQGEDYQAYRGQIAITDSQLVFGGTTSGPTVGVLGTIKNESVIPWKDIRFQLDFLDGAGHRIDAAQQQEYFFYLPAGESLSFKVSFRREFPQTNYVGHTIRVVAAKDGRTRW